MKSATAVSQNKTLTRRSYPMVAQPQMHLLTHRRQYGDLGAEDSLRLFTSPCPHAQHEVFRCEAHLHMVHACIHISSLY